MVMEPHYNGSYFFAEKYGFKKYRRPNGSVGEFGYTHGGMWNFQGVLDELCYLLGKPESVLDIGAGCGGFVATCVKNGIEALGLEFSQFAIDNAIMGAKKYLVKWDVEQTPWPVSKRYDWVCAIDLFEHLFADRVDEVIRECKRVAKRYIIAKICTAQRPHEVWSARRGSYEEVLEQAKREGFEWLVVSGHVNSQFPQYWRNKFQDKEWVIRDDLAERLKANLRLPEDWRTTLILKKYTFEL
jgi:cyclopropane fatty-acyl-phospholipid synthase-like methyltransferase